MHPVKPTHLADDVADFSNTRVAESRPEGLPAEAAAMREVFDFTYVRRRS